MELKDLLESFEEKQGKIKELQAQINQEAKDNMAGIFKEVFKNNNWLMEIAWAQYTPYFNDGDSCEFSVGESYINGCSVYNGALYEEGYYSDLDSLTIEQFMESAGESTIKKLGELTDTVEAIKNAIGDDALESIFGDHAKVVITKAGIEVQDFAHD